MTLQRVLLAAMVMLAFSCNSNTGGKKHFADCFFYDNYQFVEVTSFPDTPTRRSIALQGAAEMLSVQEGFRYTFSYKGQRLLDVAIEYPGDTAYDKDKELVKQHFRFLSAGQKTEVNMLSVKGLSGFGLTRPDLYSDQKFISINCLFDDAHQRIAYIYFRKTNNHGFDSIEEFSDHKEAVLNKIASCLKD